MRNKQTGKKRRPLPKTMSEIDIVLERAEIALEKRERPTEEDMYDLTMLLCMEAYNRKEKKRAQEILITYKKRFATEREKSKK